MAVPADRRGGECLEAPIRFDVQVAGDGQVHRRRLRPDVSEKSRQVMQPCGRVEALPVPPQQRPDRERMPLMPRAAEAPHVLFAPGDAWAPARAIQELAGHQDPGTTQRDMHLSPAALDAAIRLLETGTDTSRLAVEK